VACPARQLPGSMPLMHAQQLGASAFAFMAGSATCMRAAYRSLGWQPCTSANASTALPMNTSARIWRCPRACSGPLSWCPVMIGRVRTCHELLRSEVFPPGGGDVFWCSHYCLLYHDEAAGQLPAFSIADCYYYYYAPPRTHGISSGQLESVLSCVCWHDQYEHCALMCSCLHPIVTPALCQW
jgi:hypothetical protein